MWGKSKTPSKPAAPAIKISDADLEQLSRHYENWDGKSARDNLNDALWGEGTLLHVEYDFSLDFLMLMSGIRAKITDLIIEQIEDYRRR